MQRSEQGRRHEDMDTFIGRRRRLRKDSTDAERLVWSHLRGRGVKGFKFRRQHALGPFILDFYCVERRLGIELDGGQHFEPAVQAYDRRRTAFISEKGISLLRFSN